MRGWVGGGEERRLSACVLIGAGGGREWSAVGIKLSDPRHEEWLVECTAEPGAYRPPAERELISTPVCPQTNGGRDTLGGQERALKHTRARTQARKHAHTHTHTPCARTQKCTQTNAYFYTEAHNSQITCTDADAHTNITLDLQRGT